MAELTFAPHEIVMVIGTVWSGQKVFLVYVKSDRSFGYAPKELLRLHKMSMEMPDIFEWPEAASA